jgi:chemotaxis protein MotA
MQVFFSPKEQNLQLIETLVAFANKARRSGVVSLDADLKAIDEPFLRQALHPGGRRHRAGRAAQDHVPEHGFALRGRRPHPAVFESAGGFSPTIGILGAVLGLIQVMQHLDKIEEVGKGIAVAFVATIYGVGAANLFFLPAAGKLRIRVRDEHQRREMMLEGVISILEGINPRMLEVKLSGFLEDRETREQPHEPPRTPPRPCEPRALAGLLRRLHHAALRLLCRALRLFQGRPEEAAAGFAGHRLRISSRWASFPIRRGTQPTSRTFPRSVKTSPLRR